MNYFTLEEASLPFNYFERVGFSFDEYAIQAIQQKFPLLSNKQCQQIFEDRYDLFSDAMCELRGSTVINDYCVGESEADESTGTWGHMHFEIDDLKTAEAQLAAETVVLFNKIVSCINP